MKTKVLMKRELFGQEVKQDSKSEFFCLTDLVKAGNKWRDINQLNKFNLAQYLKTHSTVDFINEIARKYNCIPYTKGRGRNSQTWGHPLLFIDVALAISPSLKVEVYEWIFDHLIAFRNDSGDSYKKMSGALYERSNQKTRFHFEISKIAKKIQDACGAEGWQNATEEQLRLRDRIHENIALLCDVLSNSEQAVRIGIENAIKP